MPYRRRTTTRRRPRKRTYRRRRPMGRIQRSLKYKPAVHIFKRSIVENLLLSNASVPTGWVRDTGDGKSIKRNYEFTLNDLTDPTDFTNLFAYYKLNAVKQEIYSANTIADDDNSQLMVFWDTNKSSRVQGTEQSFLESQTSKRAILKPSCSLKMYTKLRQLSNLYKLTDDDYAVVRPRYVSTSEPNTPHYGCSVRISRVSGQDFGADMNNFQYLKIITTIYLSVKKIQ